MASRTAPVTIKLLAVPETTAAILYSLYDVLNGYEAAWTELTGEPHGGAGFDPRIVSPVEGAFTSRSGIPVTPHEQLTGNAVPDVIIVPDVSLRLAEDPRGRWPEVAAYLKRMHEAGATVCSVCTGSLILADAGLLDGRKATTHWGYIEMFRRCFPGVDLEPERVFVSGDHDGSVITTGGPATWEELALYLIARYRGEAAAIRAAKIWLLGDRSDGTMLYAAMVRPKRHEDKAIADAQVWLADNYGIANPVARLVERSGLPERSFKRRFKQATGYTPIDYVQTLRIEEAKQLLETTDTPVDSLGTIIGYEDPTFFRRLFKRSTGVTPSRYRQRFKGAGSEWV